MATVAANIRSGDPDTDSLLASERWNPALLLRYGFPLTGANWTGYPPNSEPFQNYAPLNGAQQAVVTAIFREVEEFANITFINSAQVGEAPETATFRFGLTDEEEVAHAYLPDTHPVGGDVWLNRSGGDFNNPFRGDYAYSAIMHEIGHALGLLHPHDGDNFGTMSLTHDNMNYTVMTYRSYQGMALEEPFPNGDFGFPQTFMLYDIAALQHMYGANFNSRSGNTLYSWNPANGFMSIDGSVAVAPGGNTIFMTIWDGGGVDTYDFSSYTNNLVVDLIPGHWTISAQGQLADLGDGHRAIGNIANAFLYHGDVRSLIENAIGGSGNDLITGNQGANSLTGGDGNDILDGGLGADILIGGNGRDIYKIDNSGDLIVETANGGDDTAEVASASYVLGANVEEMKGVSTSGGQTLTGNGSDNVILGNNFSGNILSGAGGNDTISGGTSGDHILGGDGSDRLDGLDGNDRIEGGAGDDIIDGWANDDIIDGGAGDDRLWGNQGADHILGGSGADQIQGHDDPDAIEGGDGNDSIEGGGHGDTLYGNAGDDFLYADQKPAFDPVSQTFRQPGPNDNIGIDVLIGGSGADTIEAGVGVDHIVYLDATDSTSAFRDRILKFESGSDKVDLSALVVSALSWTMLNDPGDGILYSLVTVTTPGLEMKIRIDGSVTAADFIVTIVPGATEGDDVINGTAGNDEIDALGGNDLLNLQQGGNDQVAGGPGNDDFSFGATFTAADQVNGGAGLDRLLLAGDYSAGLTLGPATLTAVERIVLGNGFDYRLVSADANVGAGSTLQVDASQLTGANSLNFDGGAETDGSFDLTGGAGNDQLTGGNGNDTVIAGAGNDIISGGDGADYLDGGAGIDTMSGGAGDDVYIVDDGSDQVLEAASAGFDTVRSAVSLTLAAEVEKLVLTGSSTINGSGNALDNILIGNSGANMLDGGLGADLMEGGFGDDIYIVDNGGDSVAELADAGTDEVRTDLAAFSLASFANVENLLGTSGTGQSLTGNAGVNIITGGSGNDLLDGGSGADVLRGGLGNDIYVLDDGGDTVTELPGEGVDEIRTGIGSYALGANVELLTGTADSGQALTGNDLANTILGGGGSDLIDGQLGPDDLRGGQGDDVYLVDNVGDSVTELPGQGNDEVRTGLSSYALGANVEKLTGTSNAGQTLTGNGLDNIIFGGTGGDLLDGGAGVDVLRGGMGNDVYVLDETSDNVAELADWGTDEVRTGLGYYALADHFENLTGTSSSGQVLVGNASSNLILGGSGNDLVDGGAGADVLRGGLGNDVYVVDDAGDNIDELPEGGVDEVRTGLTVFSLFALGTFENLTGTSASGQILEGNGLANVIVAGSGSDLLYGAGGADTLQGGLGNDVYFVDEAGDVVIELTGEGSDEIRTSLSSYSIASVANVENLTGLGNGDQNLTGNGANNVIDGGAGADTMTGGLGNDIYIVDNGGDVVVELAGEGTDEIRTLLATFSLLGLANVENITGTSNANHDFRGNAGNNVITGAGGNDFLRLQDGGIDTAIGGGGNDVILFGSTLTSADSVDGGTGIDQAVIQGDYSGGLTLGANFVSIESFAILPGNDTRFGDPGTNFYDYNLTTVNSNVAAGVTMVVDANRLRVGEDFTFNGSAETDGGFFIYGGGGTDTLLGGSGNDTFYFGENGQFGANDHVDGGAGGIDQLGLRGNYMITFGANQLTSIESMGLVSAQDTRFGGLGTAYNYNLTMNDGNVAAGVRMTVDAAPLRGAETLTFDGSAETDGSFRIFGGQGGDTIKGSQSNDLITGGTGADNLWGSGGNDSFLYRTAADSTSVARDTIHDFSIGDLLNLSQIDAIAGGGNDAFTFIGSGAFSNTAGQLRAVFDAGNNVWTVQGDINGDGVADLELIVSSDHPLVGGDFVL